MSEPTDIKRLRDLHFDRGLWPLSYQSTLNELLPALLDELEQLREFEKRVIEIIDSLETKLRERSKADE